MSNGNFTVLTYLGVRTAASVFYGDVKDGLTDVDRSKQLVHPKDIAAIGLSLLGIFAIGAVGLLETVVLPFEIISDGINLVSRNRRRS